MISCTNLHLKHTRTAPGMGLASPAACSSHRRCSVLPHADLFKIVGVTFQKRHCQRHFSSEDSFPITLQDKAIAIHKVCSSFEFGCSINWIMDIQVSSICKGILRN